jgi:hypothetical protein
MTGNGNQSSGKMKKEAKEKERSVLVGRAATTVVTSPMTAPPHNVCFVWADIKVYHHNTKTNSTNEAFTLYDLYYLPV